MLQTHVKPSSLSTNTRAGSKAAAGTRAGPVIAFALLLLLPLTEACAQTPAAAAGPTAKPAHATVSSGASDVLIEGTGSSPIRITDADLIAEAQRIPLEARASVLSRPANVQGQASNLYMKRALAEEAVQSGLADQPEIKAELRIAHDRVLAEARFAQIDAANQPSADALAAYAKTQYDANPKAYQLPERVHVRHILIKADTPDARAVAEKTLKRLQNGADFAALAKELSGDPGSAAKGGDLGPLAEGQTVAPFDKAMFALTKPGELSPIVETKFGFHILKLVERLPAQVPPFAEVKKMLMDRAATTLKQEARSKETQRLMQGSTPNQAAIDAFAAKYK